MTATPTRPMSTPCPSCQCSTPDGTLCAEDSTALSAMLAAVPQLLEQLDVAICKQAKTGTAGKAGKGTAHLKSPVNWGVAAVRDALAVELVRWTQIALGGTWLPNESRTVVARAKTVPFAGPFHDQCGHPSCERMRICWVEPAEPVDLQAARVLADNVSAIRKRPDAGRAVSGIGRAIKDAFRAIDRAQDRQYLGTCFAEEDQAVCHAELWARPGAHQVTCSQCESVHDVGERRQWLLDQAADMLCTAREAARYLGEIGGVSITEARIRGYIHRGRVIYHAGTRFRLGDLVAVAVDDSRRRSA